MLDTQFAGPGRRPSRGEAMAFTARSAEGNERIRAEFFPGRPSLFSTDFSRYPEAADPPPPDASVAEVALAVVRRQQAELDALAAEACLLGGRARRMEGTVEEAWRLFARALERAPAYLPALQTMLEMADTDERRRSLRTLLRRALEHAPGSPELGALGSRLGAGGAAARPGLRARRQGGTAVA